MMLKAGVMISLMIGMVHIRLVVSQKEKRQPICQPNPCQNGGTCVAYGNKESDQFICDCLLGLTGKLCTIPTPPSLTNEGPSPVRPGQNLHLQCRWLRDRRLKPDLYRLFEGGREVARSQGTGHFDLKQSSLVGRGGRGGRKLRFTCRVTCGPRESDPSAAVHVERQPVLCQPNPCRNGGTCVAHGNKDSGQFRCDCLRGLTGKLCTVPDCPTLTLSPPPPNPLGRGGKTTTFTCQWNRAPSLSPDTYRLYQGHDTRLLDHRNGTFDNVVTHKGGSGRAVVFTCTVVFCGKESGRSNVVRVVKPRASPQLQLLDTNKTINSFTQGDTIHFLCLRRRSVSKPCVYRLFRGKQEVDKCTTGKFSVTLTFKHGSHLVFRCTVETQGEESKRSNAVTVWVRPKAPTLTLKADDNDTRAEVREGDIVRFLCLWHGRPKPDVYRLYMDDRPLQNCSSGIIRVTVSLPGGGGHVVFRCTVVVSGKESAPSNSVKLFEKRLPAYSPPKNSQTANSKPKTFKNSRRKDSTAGASSASSAWTPIKLTPTDKKSGRKKKHETMINSWRNKNNGDYSAKKHPRKKHRMDKLGFRGSRKCKCDAKVERRKGGKRGWRNPRRRVMGKISTRFPFKSTDGRGPRSGLWLPQRQRHGRWDDVKSHRQKKKKRKKKKKKHWNPRWDWLW